MTQRQTDPASVTTGEDNPTPTRRTVIKAGAAVLALGGGGLGAALVRA